jgi:hypothetical protein
MSDFRPQDPAPGEGSARTPQTETPPEIAPSVPGWPRVGGDVNPRLSWGYEQLGRW